MARFVLVLGFLLIALTLVVHADDLEQRSLNGITRLMDLMDLMDKANAEDDGIVERRSDPEDDGIRDRRAVDVVELVNQRSIRHPDELNVLLKSSDGNDVNLRLRRGLSPTMSVENDEGIEQVQLRDAPEDAYYEVLNGQGVLMVRSVEESEGVFKRSLSGSFAHDDTAYVIEAPEAQYSSKKRDVGNDKHSLIKRFDITVSATRSKRAFQNLGVEIYLIIDYTVYSKYYSDAGRNKNTALSNIRRYYSHIISGVNMRYSNLNERDFAIYVRVKGIHVIESSRESTFSIGSGLVNPGITDPNKINAHFALNAVRTWDQGRGRGFLTKSDHVMAFTMKNLYSVKNGQAKDETVGVAFGKKLCTSDSYSLVEDKGVFSSEGTAAHELGHSLGAVDHDGENSARSCREDAKFIMAPSNAAIVDQYDHMNPFKFSTCSIRQFREYFATLGSNNCMSNHASHIPGWERPGNEAPGQLVDAIQQCHGTQDENSVPCPFKPLNDICRSLSCTTNPAGTECTATSLAARGTSCGDKKWCENAECVSNRNAPSMDESCPYGDSPGGVNGQSCSSLIRSEPYRCYETAVRGRCCDSCNKIKQGNTACEYGDHHRFCKGISRSSCSVGWNNWHCSCDKCKGAAISGCQDDPRALWDGKPCAQAVSSPGVCRQQNLAESCCGSCDKMANKSNIKCLWGDDDSYTFTLGTRRFKCADMRRDSALRNDACANHSSAPDVCCETCS